jgi:aminodeoxyfutalosine synthase
MSTAELVTLIKQVNRQPIERGTLYNEIRDYSQLSTKEIEINPLLN